ncbi:MAG: hypothetical protein ABI442_21820 [Gemmatimonadaceae bacterium]
MRFLLPRVVVPVIIISAAWIFGGRSISAMLDRIFTVALRAAPLGDMSIDDHDLSFAGRRWLLSKGGVVETNARGEVTLSSGGRTFTLAAIESGYDRNPGAYYRFHPASDDSVTYTTWRSWLAWPLLDRYSIMGGARPTRQRHLYHRLHWHKPSGATLDIEWRDEQQFYVKSGWSDMFLESPATVTIGAVPHEANVVAYLERERHWSRDAYRLEAMGDSPDGATFIVSVVHAADAQAPSPGAGRSVSLRVNRATGVVSGEIGSQ